MKVSRILPGYVRPRRAAIIAAAIGCALSLAALAIVASSSALRDAIGLRPLAVLAAGMILTANAVPWALIVALGLHERHAIRRARALEHQLCGQCAHDLRGMGTTGRCPECGTRFALDELRAAWLEVDRRAKHAAPAHTPNHHAKPHSKSHSKP